MGGRSDGENVREVLCDALAGASAGAIAATFVCPLDVIKTRLQVRGPSEVRLYSSRRNIIISSLKQIIKNEGVSGLYRGLTPTVTALLPTWTVYFTVYNQLKSLLHSHVDENKEHSIGANVLAAAGAGAATAITTNPLWVVKTRLQTQGMRDDVEPYKSMLSALRRITLEEGRKGLYSGLLPSLVGISHVAIQFPSYEKIKSYLARKENTSVDRLSPSDVAIASSLSKIIASTLTYPHEVIRARLQEQGHARNNSNKYAGVTDCIRKLRDDSSVLPPSNLYLTRSIEKA
ncbi:nicotinamide adenine dinucleotide transporter 2, mitochondrial-like isoform X2 [Zingiber officinale]|uniref:nicotinamide adenine dinucleotide transporter 2, mitochondrial-like isoform X2 n=1 Tax=Zingiber officinale TaxID=94328 RepID=UPI001C4A8316|nr:nicotinamide adenine dinucleotide transporter 2, mitochondrial-like isoform X2 [Zingiber officinale]